MKNHHRAYEDTLSTVEVLKGLLLSLDKNIVTTEDLIEFSKIGETIESKAKAEKMKNKENFNILIIEIGTNRSNLIFTTLSKKEYNCFVADTLESSYDILGMEMIDLVIVNSSASGDYEKNVIRDVQIAKFMGLFFYP